MQFFDGRVKKINYHNVIIEPKHVVIESAIDDGHTVKKLLPREGGEEWGQTDDGGERERE